MPVYACTHLRGTDMHETNTVLTYLPSLVLCILYISVSNPFFNKIDTPLLKDESEKQRIDFPF